VQIATLLLIGEKDNTAIGKGTGPKDIRKPWGLTTCWSSRAAEAISQATRIEFPIWAHSPQIQEPERFHKELD